MDNYAYEHIIGNISVSELRNTIIRFYVCNKLFRVRLRLILISFRIYEYLYKVYE